LRRLLATGGEGADSFAEGFGFVDLAGEDLASALDAAGLAVGSCDGTVAAGTSALMGRFPAKGETVQARWWLAGQLTSS
jgi:hypothetical protein